MGWWSVGEGDSNYDDNSNNDDSDYVCDADGFGGAFYWVTPCLISARPPYSWAVVS